jgi:Fe-S-cluster-containing dehydrogenase component
MLQTQPCGSTVRNTQGLLDAGGKAAIGCKTCSQDALADIHKFNQNLVLPVEVAVSKVTIYLDRLRSVSNGPQVVLVSNPEPSRGVNLTGAAAVDI